MKTDWPIGIVFVKFYYYFEITETNKWHYYQHFEVVQSLADEQSTRRRVFTKCNAYRTE